MASPQQQIEAVRRRAERIIPEAEFVEKLKTGRPLRVKFGMDPTAADVHLGHTVPLKVIRTLQDFGHKAVLIIGDYTARVGDPSGANITRPMLTPEQIDLNAQTYIDQVGKVLRMDEQHLEIRRNSEWLGQMDMNDLIKLCARKTVAQVLERDDFKKRYESGTDIRIHEFLYPLLQGWDSVMVNADVEMGGSDQLFNNMVGREFQREERGDGQCVIVAPLLVGTDGTMKMSKSKHNYIGVTDAPGGADGMFGKVMRIGDELLESYWQLLTDTPADEYRQLIKTSPRDAKVTLAKNIITQFHDAAAADVAEKAFFTATHGGVPDDIPELALPAGEHPLVPLLVQAGFVASNSEAMRKIREGGVKLDGEKLTDPKQTITLDGDRVLQLGSKRFVRLKPQ